MRAIVATVINAPTFALAIVPVTVKSISRLLSGTPVSSVAVVTAVHPAACHWSPEVPTLLSAKLTLSVRPVVGRIPTVISGETINLRVGVAAITVVGGAVSFFFAPLFEPKLQPAASTDASASAAVASIQFRRNTPRSPVTAGERNAARAGQEWRLAAAATMGRLSAWPPVEPKNTASPNANTSPFAATSQ